MPPPTSTEWISSQEESETDRLDESSEDAT
jgi:hypothetical protein